MFRSVIAVLAATALAVAPAAAQEATTASAPAAEVEQDESFRGHLITLAAFAALVVAVALLFQGDEKPASP